MLKSQPFEEWREIPVDAKLTKRYAVSNYGRMISFTEDDYTDARILKNSKVEGYPVWRYQTTHPTKKKKKISKGILVHKLVAQAFLPNTNNERKYVIHLDFVKDNNKVSNLKWATLQEMSQHNTQSSAFMAARKKLVNYIKNPHDGQKLTIERARLLKKKILDPNRKTRYKMLAKQFGVSEMAIYRIKSGENWGHLKID